MTAYVHIGTPKTGTTTIQKFLSDNRELLLKQGYYYPYQYAHGEHWKICKLFKLQSESISEEYFQVALSKDKTELNNLNIRFKDELWKQNLDKVILSSECILEFSTQLKDVYNLRQCLINLGFHKIFIILYLRNPFDTAVSFYNTELLLNRKSRYSMFDDYSNSLNYGYHVCNHKKTILWYQEVFGKENIKIRIFDKNYFIKNNFVVDFLESVGIRWDSKFVVPCFQNETINLLGIQICRSVNKFKIQTNLMLLLQKHFTSKDPHLKFQPSKKIAQAYIDYFEESNEWVRKEFFPYKERLFPKQDLTNYKENYELKEMKPEYWDKIAEFIVDIVKIKDNIILNKTNIIQDKDKVIANQTNQINYLQATLQKNENKLIQIQNLNNTLSK
ncbi:hypothetical protein YZ24_08275, partial [Campylobacter lari]|nr:hypothetical protein [Campylobacter lari]